MRKCIREGKARITTKMYCSMPVQREMDYRVSEFKIEIAGTTVKLPIYAASGLHHRIYSTHER